MDESQRNVKFSASHLVYERKFDTALRSSHANSVLKAYNDTSTPRSNALQILESHLTSFHSSTLTLHANVHVFPAILQLIINDTTSHSGSAEVKHHSRIIKRLLNIQLETQYDQVCDSHQVKSDEFLTNLEYQLSSNQMISRLLKYYHKSTTLVDALPQCDTLRFPKDDESKIKYKEKWDKCRMTWKSINVKFSWNRSSCIIETEDALTLVPRSYLLMIHNKIADILSVLTLCASTPNSIYNVDALYEVSTFVSIYCKIALTYQNKFFNISKVLEAIVTGEILIAVEGQGNKAFLNSVSEDLYTTLGFDYDISSLKEFLTSLPVPLMYEIGCLSKIMGHPFCDMEETALDLYTKTHEEIPVNVEYVSKSVRCAKYHFITSYHRRHMTWPPVDIDENAPRSLLRCAELNRSLKSSIHQQEYGPITMEDMDYVTIQECLHFDHIENFLPYVKDKAVSLTRSKVLAKYLSDNPTKSRPIDYKETRALLMYLLCNPDELEHISYMKAFESSEWDIVEPYLVIRAVPKEKEHKVKARCFGCKPIVERARTIVVGINAASFLSKYCSSQAMTISELELAYKLYSLRNLKQAYRSYEQLVVCIDASAWNSRQRIEAIAPVANAVLDKAYGTKHFSQTHLAYHKSLIYIPDVEKVHSWEGQSGGIEGLDQYVWDDVYINQLRVGMDSQGYPYEILIKGDDARIVILIPPTSLEHRSLDDIRRELVRNISKIIEQFGHKVKIEDSYGSNKVVIWSKEAFIGNVALGQGFRKIQKAYGANNAFLTTIDDYIASSFSNCHSASKVYPSPISCYVVAVWWSLVSMQRSPIYSKLHDEELVTLLLVPNLLGGFPIIFSHNFYQRAESDLLSSFIMYYMQTMRIDKPVAESISRMLTFDKESPREAFTALCIDPYSLPFRFPETPQCLLRNAVRRILPDWSRNDQVLNLFEARESSFQMILDRALYNTSPWNPKIFNCIHSCSPEGIIIELIAKFESGRSIYDALILKGRGSAIKTLIKAYRASRKRDQTRIQKLKGGYLGYELRVSPTTCPAQQAQTMRENLWRHKIEGITQPPVMHIVHIGTPSDFLMNPAAEYTHFEYTWIPPQIQKCQLFHEGTFAPFLGRSTGKGLTRPSANITTKNIFAIKVATLVEMYQWTSMPGEVPVNKVSLADIVAQMVLKYTGRLITEFAAFLPRRPTGRTTHHHVRANNYRPAIIPNTLSTGYTWIKGDSHTHLRLEGNPAHFKFNFWEIYCWTASMLLLPAWIGAKVREPSTTWVVTTQCDFCNSAIEEELLITDPVYLPRIHLLEMFTPAHNAIQDIIDDLEEYDPADYYAPDVANEIDANLLFGCLSQFLFDSSWESYMRLVDEQLHHVATAVGVTILSQWYDTQGSLLLSVKEILAIPINEIINALIPLVASYIITTYPSVTYENVSTILSMIEPHLFPWSSVLTLLQNANKFRELQSIVATLCPNVIESSYDSVQTYSSTFGSILYRHWLMNPLTDYIVCVCSFTGGSDRLPGRVSRKRLKAIRELKTIAILRPMCLVVTASAPVYERFRKLLVLTLIRYTEFSYEIQLNLNIENEIIRTEVLAISREQLDWDELIEGFDSNARELSFLKPLIRPFRLQDTIDGMLTWMAEYPDEFDQIDNEVINMFALHPISLYKLDLLSCKEQLKRFIQIRNLGPQDLEPDARFICPNFRVDPTVIRWNVRNFVVTANILVLNPEIEHNIKSQLADHNIGIDETALNTRWRLRVFGTGNISMSRLVWLFNTISLTNLPSNINVCALADGYGGYASVINAMTTDSKIIFITSPTGSGETPIPIHLINNTRGNEIIHKQMVVGRWDLTDSSNFLAIERDYPAVLNIITCDAEIAGGTSIELDYMKIWTNTCTLFVRCGAESSLLIVKVYIQYYRPILYMINILRNYSSTIMLLLPPVSPLSGEMFLVARKGNRMDPLEYDASCRFPPIPTQMSFLRFVESYIAHETGDPGGTNSLSLNFNLPVFIKRYINILPPLGWERISCIMKTPIDNTYIHRRNLEDRITFANRLLMFLNPWLDQYYAEILGPDGQVRFELYYNTLTHKMLMFSRLLTVQAFAYIVKLYRANVPLRIQNASQEYMSTIEPFNALFPQLIAPYEDHETWEVCLAGKFYPIKSWFQGMRWGVAAIVYSTQRRDA